MLKKKQIKGFTLIELMVVMAIIAVLSVLIIGAITVARQAQRSTMRQADAKTFQTALEAYFAANKAYPGTTGTWSSVYDNTSNVRAVTAFQTYLPTTKVNADPNGSTTLIDYCPISTSTYKLVVLTEGTSIASPGASCAGTLPASGVSDFSVQ